VSEWKEGWPTAADVRALPVDALVELAVTSLEGGRACVLCGAAFLFDNVDYLESSVYSDASTDLAEVFKTTRQVAHQREWRICDS
jgi:hypothetical protein